MQGTGETILAATKQQALRVVYVIFSGHWLRLRKTDMRFL
jgi:hypothetical protein